MQSSAEPVMGLILWGSLTDAFSKWSQSAKATGIQLSVIAATKSRFDRVLISVLLLVCPGISCCHAQQWRPSFHSKLSESMEPICIASVLRLYL
jgi:hypothetical protein